MLGIFEWTLAKVDTAATMHVHAHCSMIGAFVNVNELVLLQYTILVKFYVASFANF